MDSLKKIMNLVNNKKFVIFTFISLITLCFIVICILNFKTPLLVDDFVYSFIYQTSDRLNNIYDVFISQKNHYFLWGGRNVAHFCVQFFLLFNKSLFNVVNSVVYVGFILLIYFCCNIGRRTNISLFIIINLLIWTFIDVFGQTILWLTGSCNYMWGTTFIMLTILPYRIYLEKLQDKDNLLKIILLFFSGVISGWTNENAALAMIFIIIMFIVSYKFLCKIKVPKWSISGLVGSIIGYSIMMLSPGNYLRAKTYPIECDNILLKYFNCFKTISINGINRLFIIALILVILLCISIYFNGKKLNANRITSIIFIIGSLISMYSMIAAPVFPARAWFCVSIYFIVSVCSIYAELENNQLIKMTIVPVLTISFIPFLLSFKSAYSDISNTYNLYQERDQYILSQKNDHIYNITVNRIHPKTKYNPAFGLSDISKNKNDAVNKAIAKYYDLENIVAKK